MKVLIDQFFIEIDGECTSIVVKDHHTTNDTLSELKGTKFMGGQTLTQFKQQPCKK